MTVIIRRASTLKEGKQCLKGCGKLVSNQTGVCHDCRIVKCRGCERNFVSRYLENTCKSCSNKLAKGTPLKKYIEKTPVL